MLRQSDRPRAGHAVIVCALIAALSACGIKGPLRPAPKNAATPPPAVENQAQPPATTSPALPPPAAPPVRQ